MKISTKIPLLKDKNKKIIYDQLYIKKVILGFSFIGLTIILITYFNVFSYFENTVNIYFLDVGQGDCIVIEDGNFCFVIDGGGIRFNNQIENTGTNILIPFLLEKNIHRVDCVFITHFHYDHAKGVIELLEKFPVDAIAIADIDRDEWLASKKIENEVTSLYQDMKKLALRENVRIFSMQEADKILGKNARITCVYPFVASVYNDNENNNSLVLLVEVGNFQLLLTGDIETPVEDVLLEKISKFDTIDVMKIAHHGSKTSTSPEFINLLRPDVAILCVGTNLFGHPHKNTLDLLGELEIPLYSTKKCGMIEVKVSKNKYTLHAFKGELLNEAIKGTY